MSTVSGKGTVSSKGTVPTHAGTADPDAEGSARGVHAQVTALTAPVHLMRPRVARTGAVSHTFRPYVYRGHTV